MKIIWLVVFNKNYGGSKGLTGLKGGGGIGGTLLCIDFKVATVFLVQAVIMIALSANMYKCPEFCDIDFFSTLNTISERRILKQQIGMKNRFDLLTFYQE